MAADWFNVGVFLKIACHELEVIRNDNRDSMTCLREMLATWLRRTDASPSVLVWALRSARTTVLARKVAIKHGEQD